MKNAKYSNLTLAILLLSPVAGFGQKYLEPLVRSVPRAVEGAAAKNLTQNAAADAANRVAVATTGADVDPLALSGVDAAWLRSWQFGKVPTVTVHYGPMGLADISPMMVPTPGEIFIDGRMYIPFTQGVSKDYQYSERDGIDATWLSTPAYEEMDNKARLENLTYKTAILRAQARSQRFYSSLHSETVEGEIPFSRILPSQRLDRLYVLVQHGQTFENEVVNIVRAAKQKYPTRPIVFATEYVWDNSTKVIPVSGENPSTLLRVVGNEEEQPGTLRMARTQQELEKISDGDYQRYPFLQEIVKEGVVIVGIEPGTSLANAVVEEMALFTELPKGFIASMGIGMLEAYFQNLSTSEGGMRLRNQRWEDNLVSISQQYPDALIIVMGGAKHLSAAEVYSVPNLTQSGGKSFSIMLFEQNIKNIVSPIVSGLEDRTYQQFLQQSEATKGQTPLRYILSLKKPSTDGARTAQDIENSKRAVGADVLVIFPSSEKKW